MDPEQTLKMNPGVENVSRKAEKFRKGFSLELGERTAFCPDPKSQQCIRGWSSKF
jgi:hypothetical protein